MITQDNVNNVLAFITPGILQLLTEKRNISDEAAADLLYNSRLYSLLENESTKLWHLGFPLLFDMLEEELETGNITFPEEQ
jgi:hypothetical protein